MNKNNLKNKLSEVYDHIMLNCISGQYDWNRKGIIVADDENDGILNFVKTSLNFDDLKVAGKVNEITVDNSWTPYMRTSGEMQALECWNKLVVAAYKANHGLLVINVSNIELFAHCWQLKQLAKQENPLVLWPALGKSFKHYTKEELQTLWEDIKRKYNHLDADKIIELIEGFKFDGYVLINIEGQTWDEVNDFANRNNKGEFDAMMQFYYLVTDLI